MIGTSARTAVGVNVGEPLNIEIAPAGDGWVVRFDGEVALRHVDIAGAYQGALGLCADLFDRGVRARVVERAPCLA